MKKITFEEKLNVIKQSTDEDFKLFTPNQRFIAEKIKEGAKVQDIVKIMKCSKQNVHSKINTIVKKLTTPDDYKKMTRKNTKKQDEHKNKKSSKSIQFDFKQYSDFSVLTEREKQIVTLYMQNPNLTYKAIGEQLNITPNTVGVLLSNVRKKLSGSWNKHQKYYREYTKKYHEEHREETLQYRKAYYEKNREKLIEDMKKYNKEYYKSRKKN